jgi:hypothetical protein
MSTEIYQKLVEAQRLASAKISTIKEDLEKRLTQPSENSRQMEYGQIKSSARYIMRNLGYEWILIEDVEDKYVRMYIRDDLRMLVKMISKKWHPKPDRIWLQLRDYCLEMAAAVKARQEIQRLRSGH